MTVCQPAKVPSVGHHFAAIVWVLQYPQSTLILHIPTLYSTIQFNSDTFSLPGVASDSIGESLSLTRLPSTQSKVLGLQFSWLTMYCKYLKIFCILWCFGVFSLFSFWEHGPEWNMIQLNKAEYFSNFTNDINLHIQEVKWNPGKTDLMKSMTRHIIIQLLKTEDKGKKCESSHRKMTHNL